MTGQPTLLAVLLEDRGWHRYGSFRTAYEKAARSLDRERGGIAPSRAQFHRWLTGDLRGLPYTDHCRVLEHMLTGYSVRQLFNPCSNGVPVPHLTGVTDPSPGHRVARTPPAIAGTADVEAVFASRSDFAASVEPAALLEGASRIRAAGLSLNLLCQQMPDQQLLRLLSEGTQLRCLFLDPAGEAMATREREEEYKPGFLASLTNFNIQVLSRLRDRLPAGVRERVHIAVYDETIRFNIVLVDDHTCVVQPYLPYARGIESPTLLLRHHSALGGLYPVFEQVYEALTERSRKV
jgi:hypothetical protein